MQAPKIFIVFILYIFISTVNIKVVNAQAFIEFIYDNAGRRTVRKITAGRMEAKDNKEEKKNIKKHSEKVVVYPNPVNNMLNINIDSLPADSISYFTIHNITGGFISQKFITSPQENADFSKFPTGIYVVSVYVGRNSYKWKIIKE
ncbi:MAG: T9SS type A sorting domain-containing protein [Cytophagales bacterium]|nr:T9SS type A sorting domain-containing protein [Cytophagales bacterium]